MAAMVKHKSPDGVHVFDHVYGLGPVALLKTHSKYVRQYNFQQEAEGMNGPKPAEHASIEECLTFSLAAPSSGASELKT